MPTIHELLRNAPPDREYFLRHILKLDKGELLLALNKTISSAQLTKLRALERKRAAGWPVQYLLGEAWFYGIKLNVTRDVLIPRPETELIIDRIIALTHEHSVCSIVDLGTGSGAIAIAAALNTSAPVTAVDISPKALAVARANARANKARIKFYTGDVRTAIAWPKTKHVILAANLPYLSTERMKRLSQEVRREPKLALYGGPDGLHIYKRMMQFFNKTRAPHQSVTILCEIDPEQKTKLASLAARELSNCRVEFHRDLHGDVRLAEITL